MGTYKACEAHLAAMVWAFAPNAQNGAVTITVKNPEPYDGCSFCGESHYFELSYHPREK